MFPPPAFSSKYPRSEIDIRDTRSCEVADFGLRYDGRVTGVLRSMSGQPIADVTVQVMASQRSNPRGPAETVSAKTDSAGYYELSELPPGDYVVGVELQRRMENEGEQIRPRTFYPGTPDVARAAVIRIGEGNRVELDPMVLPAARERRRLTGVVVWPDGTPVPGAFTSLWDGEASWRQVAVGSKTDEQGRFEFTVVRRSELRRASVLQYPGRCRAPAGARAEQRVRCVSEDPAAPRRGDLATGSLVPPVADCGLRTPDSGLRTSDSGLAIQD